MSKFDAPGNGDMLLNTTFVLPVKSGRIPDHFSSILLKIARMSIKRPRGGAQVSMTLVMTFYLLIVYPRILQGVHADTI